VLDELAGRGRMSFKAHRSNARVAEGRLAPGAPRFVLAKPNSYMNESGGPVGSLAKFYKVDPAHVVVVHDELDIPFDTIRLKIGGSAGGHNGLRSIDRALGPDYLRVRVGVGRPPGRMDAAAFVLQDFSRDERAALPNLLVDAADAVEDVTRLGLEAAQQRWHAPR
jgi:peptidyl-tRNA hydrolase, PTH1 family